MWPVTHVTHVKKTTHHGGETLKLKLLFGPLKLLKLVNRCKRRETYKMAVLTAITYFKTLFANMHFNSFTKQLIFPTRKI